MVDADPLRRQGRPHPRRRPWGLAGERRRNGKPVRRGAAADDFRGALPRCGGRRCRCGPRRRDGSGSGADRRCEGARLASRDRWRNRALACDPAISQPRETFPGGRSSTEPDGFAIETKSPRRFATRASIPPNRSSRVAAPASRPRCWCWASRGSGCKALVSMTGPGPSGARAHRSSYRVRTRTARPMHLNDIRSTVAVWHS